MFDFDRGALAVRSSRRARAVVLVLALVGCKATPAARRDADAGDPGQGSALGWRVDAPGELIQAGSVRTTPPGQEEALMGIVPNAVREAALRCRADASAASLPGTVIIRLEIIGDGGLRRLGDPPTHAFSRCLLDDLFRTVRAPTANVAVVELRLLLRSE